jgi:uncharacterized protein (DUF305 family)
MTMTFHKNLSQKARMCGAAITLAFTTVAAPAVANEPAPTRAQAQYEIRFMTDMIDHHQMAINMSQICLTNATHEELKAMCADIIAAQQQEIVTMQTWLQDWYGVSYAPQSEMFGA